VSPSFASVRADLNEPIIFRTTNADVYQATLASGSLWLRSDQYYREVEDLARKDAGEGVNASMTTLPLRFASETGPRLQICGEGHIGQQIVPHYILSMHGASISYEQLCSLGGCTFGIRSVTILCAEVLYRSSLVLPCHGYRYGPVHYQFTPLTQSRDSSGSAMKISETPPTYLKSLNTDVLRKLPIKPFVEQDEWRIAIFTDGYIGSDPMLPLKINVDPHHFYAYQSA
jgi:hypothetical protein